MMIHRLPIVGLKVASAVALLFTCLLAHALPDEALGKVQAEHLAARRAIEQEDLRHTRAMQACSTGLASGLCSEREMHLHRSVAPGLLQQAHHAAQQVREVRAKQRSQSQAQRIQRQALSSSGASAKREISEQKRAKRYEEKLRAQEARQSDQAVARRAKSVARYEAKLARHREKMARLDAKKMQAANGQH